MQKSNIDKRGKSGFTLVELSVALALVAIVTTMMVSFSVVFNGFVESNRAEFAFYEQSDKLKQELKSWLAEIDSPDREFVSHGGYLHIEESGNSVSSVNFARNVLYMGSEQVDGFDAIDRVTFEVGVGENKKLIKCITHCSKGISGQTECSFVFYVRSGSVQEVTEGE